MNNEAGGLGEDELILEKSLEMKELAVSEGVFVHSMMCSVIFRDLGKAESLARKYLDLFERQDVGGPMQFVNIYRCVVPLSRPLREDTSNKLTFAFFRN